MTFLPIGGAGLESGSVIEWTTNTPPTGWLLCYGQAVSRTTYARLFTKIGTTFGVGDGSTTFNLPDTRGRIPLGKDDMGGTGANRVTSSQADSIGGNSGNESVTVTEGQLPSHNHSLTNKANETSGAFANTSGGGTTYTPGTGSKGGGGSHENVSPFLTLNYIIKD